MNDAYEKRVQNQFGGFCTKVLKNEVRHIQREYARQREREKSIDDLTSVELEQTAHEDPYFNGMTDREISEQIGACRQSITKRRNGALNLLRRLLIKEGYE